MRCQKEGWVVVSGTGRVYHTISVSVMCQCACSALGLSSLSVFLVIIYESHLFSLMASKPSLTDTISLDSSSKLKCCQHLTILNDIVIFCDDQLFSPDDIQLICLLWGYHGGKWFSSNWPSKLNQYLKGYLPSPQSVYEICSVFIAAVLKQSKTSSPGNTVSIFYFQINSPLSAY